MSTSTMSQTNATTCSSACVVNGVKTTCQDHIQQASLRDFLGHPKSCALAQGVIAKLCPVCRTCPPHEAGCGILEVPTTTTTFPPGNPCDAVCMLGGQPATCRARVMWAFDHIFTNKPKACAQSHAMVLDQCSVCRICTVENTKCKDDAEENFEEIFGCSSSEKSFLWSDAKKAWCCRHHKKACDLVPTKKVFFQKKISDG